MYDYERSATLISMWPLYIPTNLTKLEEETITLIKQKLPIIQKVTIVPTQMNTKQRRANCFQLLPINKQI